MEPRHSREIYISGHKLQAPLSRTELGMMCKSIVFNTRSPDPVTTTGQQLTHSACRRESFPQNTSQSARQSSVKEKGSKLHIASKQTNKQSLANKQRLTFIHSTNDNTLCITSGVGWDGMGYTEKIEKSKYIHYRNRGSGFPLFHKINYNITWTENMSTSHKHSHRKNWNFGCRITWYFRRGQMHPASLQTD